MDASYLGTLDGRVLAFGTRTTGAAGELTAISPNRILDTRIGLGRPEGSTEPLGEGVTFDVQVTGTAGIPSSPAPIAVVLNVTATEPTATSFLRIWPTSGAAPRAVSNLNFVAGQTVPNLVTVQLNTSGKLSVFNKFGNVHVIFDVVGYYANSDGAPGSRFHPADAESVVRHACSGTPIGAGESMPFDVLGKGGVPVADRGVTVVVMNVTVTEPTWDGYLTVYPGDVADRPTASNLNFVAGQTVPNLVTVKVPASGVIKFYNHQGSSQVVADVVGYYDGDRSTEAGRFFPIDPTRLVDTRGSRIPVGSADTLALSAPPPVDVSGLVLNVTVTDPTTDGFETVYPFPGPVPVASNLNFVVGQTVPNLVITGIGSGGQFGVFNQQGFTHVIVDEFGYFTSG